MRAKGNSESVMLQATYSALFSLEKAADVPCALIKQELTDFRSKSTHLQ